MSKSYKMRTRGLGNVVDSVLANYLSVLVKV